MKKVKSSSLLCVLIEFDSPCGNFCNLNFFLCYCMSYNMFTHTHTHIHIYCIDILHIYIFRSILLDLSTSCRIHPLVS